MSLPPLFGYNFPTYLKETYDNLLNVYWYQGEFTQSRYPPGQEISEACTLICLLLAQRIVDTGILLYSIEGCGEMNILMAEAMCEGNAIHAWIVQQKLIPHPYLNTEEALKYGGKSLSGLKEWRFRVIRENIEDALCPNIESFLHDWYKCPKSENLFMLLITCGRTVLFIFQEKSNKITLFDSHGHSTPNRPNRGLVVAQVTFKNLDLLCDWYVEEVLHNCYHLDANQYELAFLSHSSHYAKNRYDCGCGGCYRA